MQRLCACSLCVLFISAVLVGCGSGGPATGDVAGTVEFNGQPISDGMITFHSSGTGTAMMTRIKEGKYEFDTPLDVGEYAVYVTPPLPEPQDPRLGVAPPKVATNIPAKAQDMTTSGLIAKVEPGDNTIPLTLKE
jgi:hypothetical protein